MKYWDYIQVEPLLALQRGVHPAGDEPSKDELLFIVVHQVYELWFKVVLRELTEVRHLFRRNPVPDQALADAVRSLRRIVTVFDVATQHWSVVETLTTRDYLQFRDQLIGASGFQSAQMRQIEILLGLEDEKRIALAGEASYQDVLRNEDGSASGALHEVQRELAAGPSYKAALYEWLARTPIDGSSEPADVEAYIERFLDAHARQLGTLLDRARAHAGPADVPILQERYERESARARRFLLAEEPGLTTDERAHRRHRRAALVFIESHRELPRLSWPREVVDATVLMEQRMIVWRQRHARMVERMIGRRTGTGGSGGVEYLDATALQYRIFDDIWDVRTVLLREDLVPKLRHPDDYRFRVED